MPLGADEIQGDLAELFGHVNRALPDAELNAFVDAPAVRIASFDKQAIAEAKCLDEQVAALIDGCPGISECNAFPDATDPWDAFPAAGSDLPSLLGYLATWGSSCRLPVFRTNGRQNEPPIK